MVQCRRYSPSQLVDLRFLSFVPPALVLLLRRVFVSVCYRYADVEGDGQTTCRLSTYFKNGVLREMLRDCGHGEGRGILGRCQQDLHRGNMPFSLLVLDE